MRIKRLKKDGSADVESVRAAAVHIRSGSDVLVPIDGVYGIVRMCRPDTCTLDSSLHQIEYIVNDFGALEGMTRYNKADYDFLKRVWPDEITVLMNPREGNDPVMARMPQSPVSREIVTLAGGAVTFTPLLNEKGKPRYKTQELDGEAKGKVRFMLVIDEWCKPHQLPTVIDIRNGVPRLVRAGRVSMDEISSLYYLGSPE